MSDAHFQAAPTARVFAFVDGGNAEIENLVKDLVETHGWKRRQLAGIHHEILETAQVLDTSGTVSTKAGEIHQDLTSSGVDPTAVVVLVAPSTGGSEPTVGMHIENLAATPPLVEITKLIEVVLSPSGVTPSSNGSQAPGGSPPKPPDDDSKTKDAVETAPAGPAATIAATIPAFPDPGTLWQYVESGVRSDLARDTIANLNTNRVDFARRSDWVVAPEMVLLDACPSTQREALAMDMLKVRAALTNADKDARQAAADLADKNVALAGRNVELAGKRVELAGKAVDMAGEMLEHMKKWRSIARVGLVVLGITTAFSIIAVAYVLSYLAPHQDVSDVAIPIIIFVLALFAISPAVLLLRERPLEGLDKWSPSSEVADSGEAGSTASTAQTSTTTGSTAAPAAGETAKAT